MVDVYISGYLDDDTVPRFMEVEKILTKHGLTVYNPAKYELDRKIKSMLDYDNLDKAKVLLMVTDRVSIGTFIELGYVICRKKKGENVKIVVCYLGNDSYKGVKAVDFIKYVSPMTTPIDYVTVNIMDAVSKTIDFIGGKKNV